jgi:uncharacterized protein (DUF1697 family)
MTTYVALLKGINVGGHKMVAMADLRKLVAGLGLAEPQTLLQSGNLVFRAPARPAAQLERLLGAEIEKRLKVRSEIFVRTAAEWGAIVARNPFGDEAERDPGHLVMFLLKAPAKPKSVEALRAAITGPEIVRAAGAHAYVVYPEGIGRSRLTHPLIEKMLGTQVTGRNWNTVLKLAALAGQDA